MCDACKNAAREAIACLTGPQQDAIEALYATDLRYAEEEAEEKRRAADYAEERLEEAREAFARLEQVLVLARGIITEDDLTPLRKALDP